GTQQHRVLPRLQQKISRSQVRLLKHHFVASAVISGDDCLLPWPGDIYGTCQQADQYRHGFAVVMRQQPGQEFGEEYQPADTTHAKRQQFGNVQLMDSGEEYWVESNQQQDEAAG